LRYFTNRYYIVYAERTCKFYNKWISNNKF
jgi:hypothetical protein